MRNQQYVEHRTQVYKTAAVSRITGKCRSSIYQGIKNGTFPAPIKLGARSIGWLSTDIDAWINSRVEATSGKAA